MKRSARPHRLRVNCLVRTKQIWSHGLALLLSLSVFRLKSMLRLVIEQEVKLHYFPPIMENQMGMEMENEMETGII